MTYSLIYVLSSIAHILSTQYDIPIYISAVPQGVVTPCFFISPMPMTSRSQIDSRIYNEVSLDIVYMMEPNAINVTTSAYEVIDFLNENLETFDYYEEDDDDPTGVMHTYDRSVSFQDMDMHYNCTIKARGHIEVDETLMQSLEDINYEIKQS